MIFKKKSKRSYINAWNKINKSFDSKVHSYHLIHISFYRAKAAAATQGISIPYGYSTSFLPVDQGLRPTTYPFLMPGQYVAQMSYPQQVYYTIVTEYILLLHQ